MEILPAMKVCLYGINSHQIAIALIAVEIVYARKSQESPSAVMHEVRGDLLKIDAVFVPLFQTLIVLLRMLKCGIIVLVRMSDCEIQCFDARSLQTWTVLLSPTYIRL